MASTCKKLKFVSHPAINNKRLASLTQSFVKDLPDSDRPIIFIGHPFGGLVIEQVIVNASLGRSGYERLHDLVGGIILLGTPHQGSKMQEWGSIVAKLASLGDFGETALMDVVDQSSMTTFDLVFNFMQVMIQMDTAKHKAVMCFYENLPTNYLRKTDISGRWIDNHTSSIVNSSAYGVQD